MNTAEAKQKQKSMLGLFDYGALEILLREVPKAEVVEALSEAKKYFINLTQQLSERDKEIEELKEKIINKESWINQLAEDCTTSMEEIVSLKAQLTPNAKRYSEESQFEIDFSGYVKAQLSFKNNQVKVVAAMDGYGNAMKEDVIHIQSLPQEQGKNHNWVSAKCRCTTEPSFLCDYCRSFNASYGSKEQEPSEGLTLEELFKQHVEFSAKLFPHSTWESSLRGLEREIKEIEEAKADYHVIDGKENRKKLGIEYVDGFMYLLDSMKRAGLHVEELPGWFKEKISINNNRTWTQNKDKSYSHIK